MRPSIAIISIVAAAPLVSAQVNLVPFVESVNVVTEAFLQSHCAVAEGSLGNEIDSIPRSWPGFINRKLLRFSVGIANEGSQDLRISREEHPEWFEWGPCHNHWHFKDFTNYELLDDQGRDVVTGRKQAFCLMDIRRVGADARRRPSHTCNAPGISVGWADIYSYSLDGQWIDVTGVPAGTYTLRVTVNYGRLINESDYRDNTATVRNVVIPGSSYRSGGSGHRDVCEEVYTPCSSNSDCCSEVCMHASGEIKTSPGIGGQCVCARRGGRCGGDHNCCTGYCSSDNVCENRQSAYWWWWV